MQGVRLQSVAIWRGAGKGTMQGCVSALQLITQWCSGPIETVIILSSDTQPASKTITIFWQHGGSGGAVTIQDIW